MPRNAVLAGSMALPVERIDVARHKRALTVKYLPLGADKKDAVLVHAYRETKGFLHVPRQYGIKLCEDEGIEFDDRTSQGHPITCPTSPKPREYQIEPLEDIAINFNSFYDFMFRARTAFGKTICALIAAARLGRTTVVIVDQDKLKDQWISAAKMFGFEDDEIGVVQGKVCRYKGCAFTICMVQTLVSRRYPKSFYDYFGVLLADEVNVLGAPTFSRVLMDFSAAYRMGVSATPRRRDGLQKLLDYNLGKVRIWVEDEHKESSVYITTHDSVYSWYANADRKMGRFINEVAEDGSRNLMLAESILMLYDTGRDVLALSDRIEHLKHMMNLCFYMGIPDEDMGIYAGSIPQLAFAKNPTPARQPAGLVKNEATGAAEYTPIILQTISKKAKKRELEHVEANARVIFGTYGMFSKGTDIPRLNGGVDLTPRSQSEQIHGRTLRQLSGSKKPIWVTTADTNSFRSLFGLSVRIAGYEQNNAVIYRWNETEATRCNNRETVNELRDRVEFLKSMRIVQSKDGLNTLVTERGLKRSGRQAVTVNVRPIHALALPARLRALLAPGSNAKSPVTPSKIPSSQSPTPYRKRRKPLEKALPR